MKTGLAVLAILCGLVTSATCAATPDDGSVLPFPPTPSGSQAARTMQESTYRPLPQPRRLPQDAPNILIILTDDSGPALPDTYGGDIHTPTLSRIAQTGLSFNRFHTTAMCSPTRAALLMGRNHHRVGAGVITGLGNDWDGYTGMWPATSASLARVTDQARNPELQRPRGLAGSGGFLSPTERDSTFQIGPAIVFQQVGWPKVEIGERCGNGIIQCELRRQL